MALLDNPGQGQQLGTNPQVLLAGRFDVDFESYLVGFDVEIYTPAPRGKSWRLAHEQYRLALQTGQYLPLVLGRNVAGDKQNLASPHAVDRWELLDDDPP